MRDTPLSDDSNPVQTVRLDLWLWAARFFKTRSLAKHAIETGKIEVGGQRAKPSRAVRVGDALRVRLKDAPLLFFDGTLYTNDEMIVQGLLNKTGERIGHINMSGSAGSIAQLAPLNIGRKIFIHINNSNPALRDDSPERAAVEKAGWEVSYDGMDVRL